MLTEKAIDEAIAWCDNLQATVKRLAKSKDLDSTGKLLRSIKCEVDFLSDSQLEIVYTMLDYGYYMDEGVKGKNPGGMPNGGIQKAPNSRFKFGSGKGRGSLKSGINSWLVSKGIAPRVGGKFVSRKSIIFLISRSIYLQGLGPRQFFRPVWNSELKKLMPQLGSGVLGKVSEDVINSFKPLQNVSS